ncbi:antibiotic biosynthesis monooxygenase family protein [uncultured Amnibacterium sp.]|uniref:antibiotic biosynthesis monooxygenase family protein n=1 Tax=uncultured Amnibacterium sp. TaxID=1631851 RepID=UPI0035CAF279
MILEHALLPVRPGEEAAFETTLAQALPIIRSAPGCLGVTVSRCVERPAGYLLLVQWRSIEDHQTGFRGSPAYDEWRALLHHFYDPFPVVEHFTPVAEA